MSEKNIEIISKTKLALNCLSFLGNLRAKYNEQSKYSKRKLKTKRNKRRLWVRSWLGKRKRQTKLYQEFEDEDPQKFFQAFRMTIVTFNKLLDMIYPYILKKDTPMRLAIPPKTRLQVGKHCLASFNILDLIVTLQM